MMRASPAQRAFLHRCAAAILFVGVCLGAFIFWSAPPAASPSGYDDALLAPDDSRRYAHHTAANFGKVGALGDKAMRTAAHLAEPKPLAITIIVVSALLSALCFLVSRADFKGE